MKHILTIINLSLVLTIASQDIHRYTPFKGTIYDCPDSRKYKKFEPSVLDYPTVGHLVWDSIQVDSREVEEGFPDVDINGAFGIMFESQLHVDSTSLFAFELISDDGTILWINDKELLNNDFSNGFHSRKDTFLIPQGNHDIKIWFFQAYPTRFGVIFNTTRIPGDTTVNAQTFVLDNDILFDSNSHILKDTSMDVWQDFFDICERSLFVDLDISGHTDNIGSAAYNLDLSTKRAKAIKSFIINQTQIKADQISIHSHGESEPIASNKTEAGRAKNRRVEIVLKHNRCSPDRVTYLLPHAHRGHCLFFCFSSPNFFSTYYNSIILSPNCTHFYYYNSNQEK